MRHLAAQALCLAGFAALAFAMSRTQREALGVRLPREWTIMLRTAGTSLLVAAYAWLTDWQGFALGLVMFSGHTSLAAGLVHAALIARARRHAYVVNHDTNRAIEFTSSQD